MQNARLSLQLSKLAPPTSLPPSNCCPPPPPLVPGEWGEHSLAGEGAKGANTDEGTDTVVL
jgi:hypothetical protein